jgi:hypothetical protein
MLMAVETDQVEAFVAIVRGGGFTRAASILHLRICVFCRPHSDDQCSARR